MLYPVGRHFGVAPGRTHVAVLVDPLVSDPLVDNGLETLVEDWTRFDLVLAEYEAPEASRPYLLWFPLHGDADGVIDIMTQISYREAQALPHESEAFVQPRSVCAFLTGEMVDADPRRVADAISQATRVIDSHGRMRVFRFWDPRIVQHIAAGLQLDAQAPVGLGALLPQGLGALDWHYHDAFATPCVQPVRSDAREVMPRVLAPGLEQRIAFWSALNALFLRVAAAEAPDVFARHGPQFFREELTENLRPFFGKPSWSADDQIALACIRYLKKTPIERSEAFHRFAAGLRDKGYGVSASLDHLDRLPL